MGLLSLEKSASRLPVGHERLLNFANSISKTKRAMRMAERGGNMNAAKQHASKIDYLIAEKKKLLEGYRK